MNRLNKRQGFVLVVSVLKFFYVLSLILIDSLPPLLQNQVVRKGRRQIEVDTFWPAVIGIP